MDGIPHAIEDLLRDHGIRSTPARRGVLGVLRATTEPLSVAEISQRVAATGTSVDLVTVYRTVEALEQSGIVARNDRVADCWRYEIRSAAHRHSITCHRCGAIAPLDGCRLAELEQALAAETGFSDIHHSLQFYGTCPGCQS